MSDTETLPAWKRSWRAFAKHISAAGLTALRDALAADDPRLKQGGTTEPPPLLCVKDWPVERCCPVAFTGWQGDGLKTVGEVEGYFAYLCFKVDHDLGEPAGCHWFLNFWDETAYREAAPALLAEVSLALQGR